MKRILVFAFAFLCLRGLAQQIPSQIQAKRGVFTDSLFLKNKWIRSISTNLNTADSASNNVLATGSAIAPLTGSFIQNQSSEAQPADLFISGSGTIGSHNSFKNVLANYWPTVFNVTQGSGQYGLSIQRASNDQGPADIVTYKNADWGFDRPVPLFVADPLGTINFSGVAGDNSTIISPAYIGGHIEKVAPSYVSSGFNLNTTDSSGSAKRMELNAQGNLLIGSSTTNPTTNSYKLNVASGDVRFNSLSANGTVLASSDNNGVVSKLTVGDNLTITDGTLNGVHSIPGSRRYDKLSGTLIGRGTGNPEASMAEGGLWSYGWTRESVGHYTFTTVEPTFFPPYTWLHSHPSDASSNVGATRLYVASPTTLKLVVKDNNLNDTDTWQTISIEMRMYEP
jgi:hypothetical protein